MPKLPHLKPKELVKKLKQLGFYEHRQKGSYLMMIHKLKNKQVTIPMHNKTLKKGTLSAILRQTELSVDDLLS